MAKNNAVKSKPSIKKCAIFILTHKRPEQQITIATLKKAGYTGDLYLLCDTQDPTLKQYKKLYGDSVKTFDKKAYVNKFDLMTNDVKFNAVVYARNAVYDVAKKMGLDYIVVMDDDYSVFYLSVDQTGFYKRTKVTDMDRLITAHLKFLETANLDVLAFAQGGDFVGGWNGNINKNNFRPLRKAMNVFFLKVSNPIQFNGTINEDSTMGVQVAQAGGVVITNCLVQLEQTTTQKAVGGLTDIYKDAGTYQKSFYTLIASPSSTRVMYQRAVGRVHHLIQGDYAYPRIISASLKKK